MERRALLTTLGIGAAAAIGGCLSRADTNDDPANDSDPDDSAPSGGRIPAGERDRRTVGDGSLGGDSLRRPHAVALANRSGESVDATFAIHSADGPVFEEDLELGPDASIVVSLTEIARYEVEATIPDVGAATTQTVGLDPFDCNGGQTTVALQPDGRLESGTVSTTMACPDVVTERVGPGESIERGIEPAIERTNGGTHSPEGADSDDEHHSLGVENPTASPWTIRVVLSEDGDPHFDGVFELGADASANLPIAEPGEYHLDASVLETDEHKRESIDPGLFDCNASTTNATATENGELRIRTISTMIACDAGAVGGIDDQG
jgi:hypothetical protein